MNKIFLYVIIFILIVSNVFFLINKLGENRTDIISTQIESTLIDTQLNSYSLIGKYLKFSRIKKFSNKSMKNNIGNSPTLILIFNELGCNVCKEEETKFALEIASKYGRDKVIAIVQSNNPRYIQGFIRINKIEFDVYYCDDNYFFEINEIMHSPLLIVTDKFNRIVAAHIPISGKPQYSEPFHFFCRAYFN